MCALTGGNGVGFNTGGGEGGMEVKTNIIKAGNVLFNNAL